MRRIIVGIDGSEAAHRAVEMAARIAKAFGAKLTLLTVVPPLLLPSDSYSTGVEDIEQEHRRHAEHILREAAKHFDHGELAYEPVILFGSPAESIAELALAQDVDLVVVGSRGRSAVARVLLGSVSDRLVHVCRKPVLVVH